tara:strand:+ start:978 stop:1175 length:198 start_codon:yes stop_codon:yes gene_type:complete
MKVGDTVRLCPMWKYKEAIGVVKQIKKDGYVVVVWQGINGEWHYTPEQAKKIEIEDDTGRFSTKV